MTIEYTIPKKLPFKNVYQIKISLVDTKPEVWRRILVPESYTFFDLHVAIQSAMGWEDYHLHCFEKLEAGKKKYPRPILEISSPYEDEEYIREIPHSYDTETPLSSVLKQENDSILYRYDFGDNWEHNIVLEKILVKESDQKYPVCLDGELACPPEDCGSIPGYYECVDASKGKGSKDFIDWVGDWKPKDFDPKKVIFASPRKRFLETMEQ